MHLSDELQKLDELRTSGTMTETEFRQAQFMTCGTEKWRDVMPEDVQWSFGKHPVTLRLGMDILGGFIFLKSLLRWLFPKLRNGPDPSP